MKLSIDKFYNLTEKQQRQVVLVAGKRMERLLDELRYASYPHPVMVFQAWNYFIPIMEALADRVTAEHQEYPDEKLTRQETVVWMAEQLLPQIDKYLESYRGLVLNPEDANSTLYRDTEEYQQVNLTQQIVAKMLDGASAQEIVEYFNK